MSIDSPIAVLADGYGVLIDSYHETDGYALLGTYTVIQDLNGNGPAAVKPPNTSAIAADPALVVTISPNVTPIPVTGSFSATTDGYVTISSPTYVNNSFNPLSLTTAGALRVDGSAVTQPVSAVGNFTVIGNTNAGFGSSTNLVTVQGNALGTPIPVTGSFSATTDGYATASAPTYIDNTFDPLSLTLSGALRIDGSAVIQPVSGTTTANQGAAAPLYDAWPIVITDGYGNIQGSAANPIDVNAMVMFPPSLAVTQATIPWLVLDSIADGYLANILANQTNGSQQVVIDGYVQTNPNVFVENFPPIQTVSGMVIVDQGAPAPLFDAWPVEITDGNNILGTASHPLKVNVDGYVQTNPIVLQGTVPWIVDDSIADGYLAAILVNQTNGTQQVIIDGYVQTNPDVIVTNFPSVQVVSGTGNFTVVQPTASNLNATVIGTTDAGFGASTGLVTVQGNISGTPIPVTGSFSATVDGYATASSPVYVDDTFNPLSLTLSGALRVDGSAVIQPISGTVTANQGAAAPLLDAWPIIITDGYGNIQGSAANPIDVNAMVMFPSSLAVTQDTIPWVVIDSVADGYLASILANQTNGTQQVIVDGYVQTNPNVFVENFPATQAVTQSTNPWIVDVTQFGDNNVVTGTGASGAGIPRVTVSNDSNVLATQSGSWTVTANAGTGTFTVGQATAANLNATVIGTTAAGSGASIGLVTIQGNPSGTPVPVSGLITTDIDGYATSSAPTYIDDTYNPLSLTLSGALRVDGSAVTQPVSGTVTANQGMAASLSSAWPVEITDGYGNIQGSIANPIQVNIDGYVQTNPNVIVTNFPATQAVTQSTNPWTDNITQFGGNNVVTGTGASGLGIPRVTVANDSNILATQSGTWINIADGYATTTSPTYVNNTYDALSLTLAGALRVDGSAVIQPVSGTVTVNQGTNPWTNDVTDRAGRLLGIIYGSQGQQLKQTATNFNTQVEIAVGSTLIDPRSIRTLTSSDTVTVVQPTAANLNATVTQGTSPWIDNISQFGGSNVVTGTGASGAGIPRVTVSNDSNVLATQSGTWTVQQGSPPWTVSQATASNLNATIIGTTAAGSGASVGLVTIQGNASGTPVPISGTVTANNASVSGTGAAVPSSATFIGGEVQSLQVGLTSGDLYPLSLTTAALLRVDGSNVVQPVSGTVAVTQSTSPWVDNIAQFGGTNISTGIGTSGAGIPRVTVSNDSNILATQSGSWTVTSNQGSPNTLANAWPIEITDGTNVLGTSSHPVRVDPTGTTTQPVSIVSPLTGPQISNIDAGNSSTTPLSGNATFTGTGIDVSQYGTITIIVFADQVGTLFIEFSTDNLHWDFQDSYDLFANKVVHVQIGPQARYFRVVFTNGAVAQTVFRLQTIERPIIASPPVIPIDVEVDPEGDALLVKAVLTGKTNSTETAQFVDVLTNPGGDLSVCLGDTANIGPFSRLRTSHPLSLFSNKQIYDSQPLYWDDQQISGSGTSSTFLTNKAATQMTVTGNAAGVHVRQSFRRMNYQPGKGQLIFMTGVLVNEGGVGVAAVNRRIGIFDGSNGFFFELTGTTMNVAVRTSTSGSAVTTYVSQSNWNQDKFDGTGPSGITLDVSKAQIFVIDFQWLGVGRIRYGFDIGGVLYYCHYTTPANTQSLVSISNPNLPLRYEIQSLGTGSNTSYSMTHICGTVQSEGGQEDVGFIFGIDSGATSVVTGNNTNTYTALAMQLQSTRLDATIKPTTFSIMTVTANASFKLVIVINPTIAGTALSYTPVTNSALQFAIGGTTNTITGGTVIYSQYFFQNKNASSSDTLPIDVAIGSNIAGASDTMVLALQPVPALAITFFPSFNWAEQI